jgi:hypothetical protein
VRGDTHRHSSNQLPVSAASYPIEWSERGDAHYPFPTSSVIFASSRQRGPTGEMSAFENKDEVMKAHEAVIAWTPADCLESEYEETAGEVVVVNLHRRGGREWCRPFERVGGASFPARRKLRGVESTARLFIDFHQIVLRDGIDPQLAHEAFLVIDEYAGSIAPDIPGAR